MCYEVFVRKQKNPISLNGLNGSGFNGSRSGLDRSGLDRSFSRSLSSRSNLDRSNLSSGSLSNSRSSLSNSSLRVLRLRHLSVILGMSIHAILQSQRDLSAVLNEGVRILLVLRITSPHLPHCENTLLPELERLEARSRLHKHAPAALAIVLRLLAPIGYDLFHSLLVGLTVHSALRANLSLQHQSLTSQVLHAHVRLGVRIVTLHLHVLHILLRDIHVGGLLHEQSIHHRTVH